MYSNKINNNIVYYFANEQRTTRDTRAARAVVRQRF